jgi:sarcosine oxidase
MTRYDAIVLGTGGVGCAALFHLARRGARVLGIDRFAPGHDRGSSHGQTRLIRQAYYEHPNYVPLVLRAFELWHELEQLSGETLYNQVGLLQIGPPEGEVLSGVRASAQQHGLAIEELSARESSARFPGFRVPDSYEAIFEQRAGYLAVERCVIAHADQARRQGAELHDGETIIGWRSDGGGVVVETDLAKYSADRLVVCAGAWAGQLLGELDVAFEVRRKPLFWWQTRTATYRPESGCPGFLYDLPPGCFYGVPQIDSLGVKVAEHTGGAIVRDPLNVDRGVDLAERQRVADFVGEYLTDASATCVDSTVCMYTMTSDAHFVVDRHPLHPRVVFAAGLSGHGFKFTCVLGEVLAQLALDGRTELAIEFLASSRASLRGR